MNHTKTLLKILLTMVAATQLSACSKTVHWKEEVPLNTGEVLWIHRSDTFKRSSEPGNPLKFGWRLQTRTLDFSWRGQGYFYEVKTESDGPILLHIFENKTVAIVDSGWPRCDGYGEFRWVAGDWQLQKRVSPELVGKPRNLMGHYSATSGEIPAQVTQEFIRNARFDLPQNGGTATHVLASKIAANDCKGN